LFFQNVKQAVGHGLGRHSTEEIYDFGKKDLTSLSQLLADKEYFFGTEPHLLDCVAFAHLAQFVYIPFVNIDQWITENHPNLNAFVTRVRERYWPDWDRACKSLELNTHLYNEGEEPPMSEAEKKALEVKKAKEEAKKAKEEEKKAKVEQKKKEKEEKERKKAEEAERKKAEKEKAEKEKAEAAAKEAAAKQEADAAAAAAATEAEAKPAETEADKPAEEAKPAEESKDSAATEEKKE
jgi:flagellar biosynthesis GTPase FlhF